MTGLRQPTRGFWTGRTVCVTGGTGFLGFQIVRQLVRLGAQVRSFSLPLEGRHPIQSLPNVEVRSGDILDEQAVRSAVAGCSVVFHVAGPVNVWGPEVDSMIRVHVDGTRLAIQSSDPGSRFVATSSIVAQGPAEGKIPVTEQTPFDSPESTGIPYVVAKWKAERTALALASERDVVVVSPGYLFGPEDFERSIMGRFCLRTWKGRVIVAPPGGINCVDVRDVALGHLLAAEHGETGRKYLLGGEDHSFHSLIKAITAAADQSPRFLPTIPLPLLFGVAGLAECRARLIGKEPYPSLGHVRLNRFDWFCRSDRARDELGYVPRPLQETLTDTHRWFNEQGLIQLRGFQRWWLRSQPAAA